MGRCLDSIVHSDFFPETASDILIMIRPSRGASRPDYQAPGKIAGKREFPKGDRPAFREVARRITPTSPSGRHPRERGRPARMLSLRLPLSFPAMLQPTALPAGTAWARPKQRQGAAAG